MVAQEYKVDEKAFCEQQGQLYDVKILEVKVEGDKPTYKVHYQGWAKRYDTWVGAEQLSKHTAEGVARQKALKEAVEKAKAKREETGKEEVETEKKETEETRKGSKKVKETKPTKSGKKEKGAKAEDKAEKAEEKKSKKKAGPKRAGGSAQKEEAGENAASSPSPGFKRPSVDEPELTSGRKEVAVTYQRKKPRLSTGATPVLGRSSTDQWLAVLSAAKPPPPPTITPSRTHTTSILSPTHDTKPTNEKTQTQKISWVEDDSNTPVTDGDSPAKITATAPKGRKGAQQTKGKNTAQLQGSARKKGGQVKKSSGAEEKGEVEEEGGARRSSRRQAAGNVSQGEGVCGHCGMGYEEGCTHSMATHHAYHHRYMQATHFAGWKDERLVGEPSHLPGRIVCVAPGDPPSHMRKVQEIVDIVNDALGYPSSSSDEKGKEYKVYLYVTPECRVGGCVVAEAVQHAHRLLVPGTVEQGEPVPMARSDSGSALFHSTDTQRATVGISRVWVCHQHRRKGVATALLDAIRTTFHFGQLVDRHRVAFSQPTPAGQALASTYCGRADFLVYDH